MSATAMSNQINERTLHTLIANKLCSAYESVLSDIGKSIIVRYIC